MTKFETTNYNGKEYQLVPIDNLFFEGKEDPVTKKVFYVAYATKEKKQSLRNITIKEYFEDNKILTYHGVWVSDVRQLSNLVKDYLTSSETKSAFDQVLGL